MRALDCLSSRLLQPLPFVRDAMAYLRAFFLICWITASVGIGLHWWSGEPMSGAQQLVIGCALANVVLEALIHSLDDFNRYLRRRLEQRRSQI